MEFIYEPEFWIAVSFFIFIGVLVYLGIHKKVASALDARARPRSSSPRASRRSRSCSDHRLPGSSRSFDLAKSRGRREPRRHRGAILRNCRRERAHG
jgi:hypothetical protein